MAHHRQQDALHILVCVAASTVERCPGGQGVEDGAEALQRPFLTNVQRQDPFVLRRDVGVGETVRDQVCLEVWVRVDGSRRDARQ